MEKVILKCGAPLSTIMRKIWLIALLLSLGLSSFAQRQISGTVTDETGSTLIGVQVEIKGISRGTITDIDGKYSFSGVNISPNSILIFSYIGMKNFETTIGERSVIDVVMKEDNVGLDEVVVIGYGTMKKSDLTGAVGNVRIKDMEKAPVLTFDQALAGRIAGVQVSSNDGQPGSGMEIVIRGGNSLTSSNAPLYIVDGFPMEEDMNADINPNDIESISILKDASATAIYGARAANGVVVIETKKGQKGKPLIEFNASFGIQNILKKMDMMSPYEFVRYQLELDEQDAQTRYLSDGKTLDSYKNMKGYNWQDKVFRTAPVQTYNVSVRGGKDDSRYSVSGTYSDQKGVIINSGFKRYQGNLYYEQDLSKTIKMGVNIVLAQNKNYGQQPSTPAAGGLASSYTLYSVWGYRPITGGENYDLENELIDPDIDGSNDYRVNPILNLKNEIRKTTTDNTKADVFLTYNIIKDLKLKITAGLNKRKERADAFYNSNTTRGTPQIPSNSARLTNGSVTYRESTTWTNENTLTYTKKINKDHTITALGGASLQAGKTSRYGLSGVMLPNESLGLSGLDEGIPGAVIAYESENRLISFFGRFNYNYKSKYLFTGTLRADGSSKFSKDNRWGYFPSAALAWRIKEESFMDGLEFVSNAKLRLSYGLTGNNRVSDFAYMASLTLPVGADYSFNNGTPSPGVVPTEMGNNNLKWETTKQADIGIDLGFLDNRIELIADLYRKTTTDLLLYANMAYSSGFSNVYNNIGEIRNQGLELTLNTTNIRTKDFTWESSFNISFNKNKILKLDSDNMLSNITWETSYDKTPLYIAKVGGPAAKFYGYVFDGVYQISDFNVVNDKYVLKADIPTNGNVRENIQPGDIKFKDIAGDPLVVNADDRTEIGDPNPKHTGGFNNSFKYKGISLDIFFQWSYGNDVYNGNRLIFEGNSLSRVGLNQYDTYINRWTPENPSNKYFRTGGQAPKGSYSSREIEDASYLRLKTLSVSYDLPIKWVKAVKFKSIRVNASVQNLITWTNYSGMDPEVSIRNTILTPGFDYSAYPRARTIMFGINATL